MILFDEETNKRHLIRVASFLFRGDRTPLQKQQIGIFGEYTPFPFKISILLAITIKRINKHLLLSNYHPKHAPQVLAFHTRKQGGSVNGNPNDFWFCSSFSIPSLSLSLSRCCGCCWYFHVFRLYEALLTQGEKI